ncbi:MAG: hypothetical protein P1V51_06720 [Deltaproteobacteria bacterium]|nr:hypothetical protein [Deltaproteobacteria bacterium]
MAGAPESGSTFRFLSRRRFLRWTLGAGVGLAGLGVGARALWRGEEPEPPLGEDGASRLHVLTPREYRTARALAEAHLPTGGPFAPGASEAQLALAFDAFLVDEPAGNVADLKKALMLIDLGPLLFEGTPTPFHRLPLEARIAHWEGWMRSGLLLRRQVAIAFRKFYSLVFYDRPEVWRAIGYGGPSYG